MPFTAGDRMEEVKEEVVEEVEKEELQWKEQVKQEAGVGEEQKQR